MKTAASIEIDEAADASERLEAWLRDQGFFVPGGDDLVADRYLGYGLSATLRRSSAPAPPEPCRLPLAACAVGGSRYDVNNDNTLDPGSFEVPPGGGERAMNAARHSQRCRPRSSGRRSSRPAHVGGAYPRVSP